jgi:hypothetical protein
VRTLRQATDKPALKFALQLVVEFLAPHRASLELDATKVIDLAGRWAPYRAKDRQLITTSLLLFALVEAAPPSSCDNQLRAIIQKFLRALSQHRGYQSEIKIYFNKDVTSIHTDTPFLASVIGLSDNVQRLLEAAWNIEQRLGHTQLSASALGAAFLNVEQGVFLRRLEQVGFDREPFREELGRFFKDPRISPEQRVFVVHGHDTGARDSVSLFLKTIGLTPIILAEQPNLGQTIVEKFVNSAREVGFAVVLLTPDDLGGAADEAQKSRARQNVIFELGYFVGSLGRGRACLLRKGNVEIPSDLYGVVYTDLDTANGWKIGLARELKAAGFTFDASKVLA